MSSELPHLSTARLLLRGLEKHQAETLFRLANGPKIADNTANIPSPYTLETAHAFIDATAAKFHAGEVLNLGMHVHETEDLLGFAMVREDWERSR
jgi:RimJ/RimL family protein N-acetyltransferase